MENKDAFELLLRKYIDGNCSSEEIDTLFSYLNDDELYAINEKAILSELTFQESIPVLFKDNIDRITQEVEGKLLEKISEESNSRPIVRFNKLWISLAASILVIISVGIYLTFFSNRVLEGEAAIAVTNEIFPVEESPTLTLENGQTILLSDVDEIAIQSKDSLSLITKGKFSAYAENSELTLNRLFVPKGKQLKVNFSDGSSIWLNANTTLVYPSEFVGERKITLIGEGYFEVAKDNNKPFIIESANQKLIVKGTSFNLTAYPDGNAVKTTLLSGSVEVQTLNKSTSKILKPGEQSILQDEVFHISNVDQDNVSLWRKGYFDFQDYTIQDIMKELQRWYDVEIVFEGQIPKKEFFGKIKRGSSLDEVLSIF